MYSVGQGPLTLAVFKLLLLQCHCFWACNDLQGHPKCILYWCHCHLLDPQIQCVPGLSPMTIPFCSDRWIHGTLSSVPCLRSAFLSPSSRPWSGHTVVYPLPSSSWVPSSGYLVPSWSLCGWGYTVHLFTSTRQRALRQRPHSQAFSKPMLQGKDDPFL